MRDCPICVVKLGSAVITTPSGALDTAFLREICRGVSVIAAKGWAPVIVSSGARTTGRAVLRAHFGSVPEFSNERRALSAVGQSRLVTTYATLLEEHASTLVPAQVLLTRQALGQRDRYPAIRETLLDMLRNSIVPIINNNDVTNSYRVDFVDNDQITAYVAGMLEARQVIIISDAGGIYDKNPRIPGDARRIALLPSQLSAWPSIAIDDTGSSFGGMANKLEAIRLLNILGIPTRVAAKDEHDVVVRSINNKDSDFGTRVDPDESAQLNPYKRWLCTGALSKGMLLLSDPGAERLTQSANMGKSISILAVGVIGHHGLFERGDAVTIRGNNYELVGIGRVRCGSSELGKLRSERPSTIVIHANEMLASARVRFLSINDRQTVISAYRRMLDQGFNIRENRPGCGETNEGGIIRVGSKKGDEGEVCYRGIEARKVWREASHASKVIGVKVDEWIMFRATTG